jgi:hypothetical protein
MATEHGRITAALGERSAPATPDRPAVRHHQSDGTARTGSGGAFPGISARIPGGPDRTGGGPVARQIPGRHPFCSVLGALRSDRPTRARRVLNASVSSDRSGSGGADQSRAVRCQGSSDRTWTFPRRRTVYLPPEPAFLVVKLLLLGEHRQDCREAFLPRLGLLRRLQSPNNCIHICSV